MAKMFAIVQMQGGSPMIDASVTPYAGYALVDQIGNFGGYLISGTPAQLAALNALPEVIGLGVITENDTVKWRELDNAFPNATRTRLNTWLTARGLQTIPAGRTSREVVDAVMKRLNGKFDLSGIDIADS